MLGWVIRRLAERLKPDSDPTRRREDRAYGWACFAFCVVLVGTKLLPESVNLAVPKLVVALACGFVAFRWANRHDTE